MKPHKQTTSLAGFTLIELLITLAVFSILAGAILGFFSSQRDTYVREDFKMERDQNLRMAQESISMELVTAGRCAADEAFLQRLSLWVSPEYVPVIPLQVTLDANPKITWGDGELPDVITFLCAVPTATNPTTLSEDSDGTVLTLSLSNSGTDTQYRVEDILYVGYIPEYARVVEVDGKHLTIDTDPEVPGLQPLSVLHPAGAPVGEVSVISYAVFNDENDPEYKRHEAGRPLLKRKVNAGGFFPVAENISQMKVTQPAEGVLEVSLTGRPDRSQFEGTDIGDITMTTEVSLRNALNPGLASGCVPPEAPGGPVLEEGLDESFPCRILLSWDSVEVDASGDDLAETGCPVTGYRIFFDVAPGIFGNHVDVSDEDASGYDLDVSEIPSSVFHVSVAAKNSGGFGEKSSELSITDETPPDAPTGVLAVACGPNEILLSWDENAECDLAGYFIYRKKNGGAFELASGSLVSGSGYADAGLEAGASYTYRIEAVDFGFNASEFSEETTVALP